MKFRVWLHLVLSIIFTEIFWACYTIYYITNDSPAETGPFNDYLDFSEASVLFIFSMLIGNLILVMINSMMDLYEI